MHVIIFLCCFIYLNYFVNGETKCENTCKFANDRACDDGGPGALYNVCELGTDCANCGPREIQVFCKNTCPGNNNNGICEDG